MRRMDTGTVVFIALIFVLAGFVKGVVGLGLPTVGMGLLAIVMPPAQAAHCWSCHPSSPMCSRP
jgi:uncharacterized membrane protein YfcA